MEGKNDSNNIAVQPFQGVILGIIATPGIIANVFALVLTFKILRHQKIVCNVLILGLSSCDLLGIILICTPTWICYAYGKWPGGKPLCYFQGFFTLFTALTSGLIATCMAMDRYLAVRAPFFHRQRISFRFAKKVLVLIIVFCALISMMPLFGFGSFELNVTQMYCTLNWFAKSSTDKTYAYFFAIIGFLLIFIVIFTNMHVLFLILKRKKTARNLKGLRSKFQKVNETKKTAAEKIQQQYQRMMVIISSLFLICWTPFMIRIICNVSGIWKDKSADLQVSRLLLLNLVLDPFVYVLTRKQYRDTFIRLFCYCCPCVRKKRKASVKVRFAYSASIKNTDSGNNTATDQTQVPDVKLPVLKPREERASFQAIVAREPAAVQSTNALVHTDNKTQGNTIPHEKTNGEIKEQEPRRAAILIMEGKVNNSECKIPRFSNDFQDANNASPIAMDTVVPEERETLRDKQGILPTITESDVREALRDLAKDSGFANEGMNDEADDVLFSEIMETLKNCFAGMKPSHETRKMTGESSGPENPSNHDDNELLISIDSSRSQTAGDQEKNANAEPRSSPSISVKALQVMDIIQTKRRAKQIEKIV